MLMLANIIYVENGACLCDAVNLMKNRTSRHSTHHHYFIYVIDLHFSVISMTLQGQDQVGKCYQSAGRVTLKYLLVLQKMYSFLHKALYLYDKLFRIAPRQKDEFLKISTRPPQVFAGQYEWTSGESSPGGNEPTLALLNSEMQGGSQLIWELIKLS